MKTCPDCNNQTDDNSASCAACGYAFADEAKNEMQRSVESVGITLSWKTYKKGAIKAYNVINGIKTATDILNIIFFVGCAILFFVVYGKSTETILSNYILWAPLIIVVGEHLVIADKIFDTVVKRIELNQCSSWLKENALNGLKSPALAICDLSKKQKGYSGSIAHNRDIVYAANDNNYIKTRTKGYTIEIIIGIIIDIACGISGYFAVLNVILKKTDAFAIVSVAILLACLILPAFIYKLIRQKYSAPAITWMEKVKNDRQ